MPITKFNLTTFVTVEALKKKNRKMPGGNMHERSLGWDQNNFDYEKNR